MLNWDELGEPGMTAKEKEAFRTDVAKELVAALRDKSCTYRDAKAALSIASSMLEKAMLRTKI